MTDREDDGYRERQLQELRRLIRYYPQQAWEMLEELNE